MSSNLQRDPIRDIWNRLRALGRKTAHSPLVLSLSKDAADA